MRTSSKESGQSLVELALVTPLIFLTVIVCIQLMIMGRAKLLVGQTASRVAGAVTEHASPKLTYVKEVATYFGKYLNQGMPIRYTVAKTAPLLTWMSYGGVGTSKARAIIGKTTVTYGLLPKWAIGNLLNGFMLKGYDEAVIEPDTLDQ